ncbi:hypothetical protein [Enterococcus phage vB_Efm3_KEN20]
MIFNTRNQFLITFYEGKGRFSKLVWGLLCEEEGAAINSL